MMKAKWRICSPTVVIIFAFAIAGQLLNCSSDLIPASQSTERKPDQVLAAPAKEIILNWEQHGADFGWLSIDRLGRWSWHRQLNAPNGDAIPSFRFYRLPPDGLVSLRDPNVRFGLWFARTDLVGRANSWPSRGVVKDVDLKSLKRFGNLVAINLEYCKLTDADATHLGTMPQLLHLNLAFTDIQSLDSFGSLANLSTLNLDGTRVNDAAMKGISMFPRLSLLNIWIDSVTDAGVKEAAKVARLDFISVPDSTTKSGLLALCALDHLQAMSLNWSVIDEDGFSHIVAHKGLKHLDLRRAKVPELSKTRIANLTELESLYLPRTATNSDLVSIAALRALESIDACESSEINGEGIKALVGLPNLRSLNFERTQLTDAALQEIGKIFSLKELNLERTGTSDRGLSYLTGLQQLHKLNLSGNKLTGASWDSLSKFAQLTELDLSDNEKLGVGSMSIAKLQRLHTLDLNNTQTSDALLEQLSDSTQLRHFDVSGTSVTDRGFKYVATIKGLLTLNVARTDVSDTGLTELAGLNQLSVLDLSQCSRVERVGWVANLRGLRELSLLGTKVDGIEELVRLPALERLSLPTTLGGQEIMRLAGMKKLTYLRLDNTTEKILTWAAGALPNTEIVSFKR
jgi:internalin A